MLEGAEDFSVGLCQVARDPFTAVTLHLSTVGPVTYKFDFESIPVPVLNFLQPPLVVNSGNTPLLIQGNFQADYYSQQNHGIAYYCWFGHKAVWNDDFPYNTEAKIVNFTHASCTSPPAPSLSQRLAADTSIVEDNTYVYVSSSHLPNPLSSLSITYVPDPYVNYTWPNIGSSLGNEPTALIGNDFVPDADYTMAFGPKVGKCHFKSNILLLCDTPAS